MNLRRARLTLAVVACAGLVACAAPASEFASGPVADDVRTSIEWGTADFDHSEWAALLAGGTRDGLVDYGYMADQRERLDAYLTRVASAELGSLAPAHLQALLINAYNALTVRSILDHPGVSSIREIDGVWTERTHVVGGHELTLDNIEHNLLRPFFQDPRVHFAVNCASLSCAPLPGWAFEGHRLEEQLEERTRTFLRDPRNVRIEGDELVVSRYFDWYGDDFTAEGWAPRAETIPAFIAGYATADVARFIDQRGDPPLEFADYDWSLNQAEVSADRGAMTASVFQLASTAAVASSAPSQDEGDAGVSGWVMTVLDWVDGFGWGAPLVYGLLYVVLSVLLIPGGALTIGAGFAFGMVPGGLTVVLGANLAAWAAFFIARYVLRSRVEKWLAGREKLSAVDRAVEEQGWKVVVLTRLSPVFPFNVQNYFYGLTGVSFWQYAAASFVGMLPGTLLYVYIGFASAQVARAAGGAAGWGQTALLIAGLVATLVVVVQVTRVAKRELDRATGGRVSEAENNAGAGGEASAPA